MKRSFPEKSTGSWGMIASFERSSWVPTSCAKRLFCQPVLALCPSCRAHLGKGMIGFSKKVEAHKGAPKGIFAPQWYCRPSAHPDRSRCCRAEQSRAAAQQTERHSETDVCTHVSRNPLMRPEFGCNHLLNRPSSIMLKPIYRVKMKKAYSIVRVYCAHRFTGKRIA